MPISRFPKVRSTVVDGIYFDSVGTASTAHIAADVPKDSLIKVFPSPAGTADSATLYTTLRYISKSDDDDQDAAMSAITSNTNRDWEAWTSGAVSESTTTVTNGPIAGVCLVVAGGSWTVEVTRGE